MKVLIAVILLLGIIGSMVYFNQPKSEMVCERVPYELKECIPTHRLPCPSPSAPQYPVDVSTGKEVYDYLKCEVVE